MTGKFRVTTDDVQPTQIAMSATAFSPVKIYRIRATNGGFMVASGNEKFHLHEDYTVDVAYNGGLISAKPLDGAGPAATYGEYEIVT